MCFSRSPPSMAFSDAATVGAAGAGGVGPWALDVPCMQSPSPATNRRWRIRVLKIISPVMFKWTALNYTENPTCGVNAPFGSVISGKILEVANRQVVEPQEQFTISQDFWRNSGFHLLERDDEGRLSITDDFLRAYLMRPEIRPAEESGPNEIALHDALMDEPRRIRPRRRCRPSRTRTPATTIEFCSRSSAD